MNQRTDTIQAKRFPLITVLVAIVLVAGGCNLLGDDSKLEQPQFNYKVFNEQGEMLKRVTHEKVEEIEIETSLGLFGENFIPTEFLEPIEGPYEGFKLHEIYLHAENGVNETVQFVTLQFSFPVMEEWKAGTYPIPELSKEEFKQQMQLLWQGYQDTTIDTTGSLNFPFNPNDLITAGNLATMNYFDSGFVTERSYGMRIEVDNNLYQSTGGSIELTDVSGDRLKGKFTVELLSASMNLVFFNEEFPEDPDLQRYRIVGDFVAEHGDYSDLRKAHTDFLDPFGSFGGFFGF